MNQEFKKALEAFKMFPNSSIAKKNLLNELDKLKKDLGRRKNKKYTGQKLGDILSPYTGSEFAEEANDFLRAASEDLNEAKNDLFDMKSELFEEIRDVRKKMQKDIERQKQKIRQDINKRKGFPPPPPIPPKSRKIPNVGRYGSDSCVVNNAFGTYGCTTTNSIGEQLDNMMDKESKVLYGDIMKGHTNHNQQKFHHESMDDFQKRVKIQTKLRCQVLFDDDAEYYVLDFLRKPLVRVDYRHEILGEDYEILKKNDHYFTNEDINAVVEANMPISSWFFKTFWPSEVAVMKIKIKKSNIKLEPDEKENDVE